MAEDPELAEARHVFAALRKRRNTLTERIAALTAERGQVETTMAGLKTLYPGVGVIYVKRRAVKHPEVEAAAPAPVVALPRGRTAALYALAPYPEKALTVNVVAQEFLRRGWPLGSAKRDRTASLRISLDRCVRDGLATKVTDESAGTVSYRITDAGLREVERLRRNEELPLSEEAELDDTEEVSTS